jgi:hypothetical protein
MRPIPEVLAWVVYRMTLHGKSQQGTAVCEQNEWDEIQASRPGYHTLVRSGITSEAEAEKLARGSAGDKVGARSRRM